VSPRYLNMSPLCNITALMQLPWRHCCTTAQPSGTPCTALPTAVLPTNQPCARTLPTCMRQCRQLWSRVAAGPGKCRPRSRPPGLAGRHPAANSGSSLGEAGGTAWGQVVANSGRSQGHTC
jgi:hypothetical protein